MSNAVKILKHLETPKAPGVYHRLVCLTGENKGKAYYFIAKRVVMGRSENCDITIADIKSSREHAEIITVGNDYILTDLGSQNGIIVNDLKVKQHPLVDGDKVIVGKTVYKFSKIEVAGSKKRSKKKRKSSEIDEEQEPENKKMTMVLGAIAVLAFLLLFMGEEEPTPRDQKKTAQTQVREVDDSLMKALKQRAKDNKKNNEKMAIYFKKGLREYREGNYFRAIAQFENAQQENPNDPLANFYLRKTRESLDESIEGYFSQAIRDADAINYRRAVTSYCTIIRILNNYKSDRRYVAALEGVRNMEKKLGLEEGEIKCIDKGDEN